MLWWLSLTLKDYVAANPDDEEAKNKLRALLLK